jgi:circadian clock protein KaiC
LLEPAGVSEAAHQGSASGVPGLDRVLACGLEAGGLYLVEGMAGAGKTLLSLQIGFHRARAGEKVLFVSLMAESHGKLLDYVGRMRFFDEALTGRLVLFHSGYASLAEGGLEGFFEFLARSVREHRPALLIVDGFRNALERRASDLPVARFIHELNSLAALTRCTTLVLLPEAGSEPRPEHTLVDGLIELTRHASGMRVVRELEVHKLRGADHLLGKHVFTITADGLTVYPRLEATAARQPRAAPENSARRAFGIARLDQMLHGGLVGGSTTSILGAPGAGKTLLALKFLEQGLSEGQPALYFGFFESPERLLAKARGVGVALQPAARDGRLQIIWQPPLEYTMDELGSRLLDAVRATKARRVAVDSIDGFRQSAMRKERFSMYMTALTTELRALDADTILTEELPLEHYGAPPQQLLMSALLENVLHVRYAEAGSKLRRQLAVLKMRESDYDSTIREFRISERGIEVDRGDQA